MSLEPVPFRKGRAHAPRLSKPYVRGRRDERYWEDAELDVLRQHYATRGPAYCAGLLPKRKLRAIYLQAHLLNLRAPRMPAQRRRHDTATIDAALREAAPTLSARGALTALADRLGVPSWLVKRRATQLGLSQLHRKEPPWTDAEEGLLRKVPLHDLSRASAVFRAHGFERTPTSLGVKAKRLSISRRYTGALSATAAAKILGVDSKTMACWCLEGLVKAGRRGTNRLPQQGGDWHTIPRAELRRFVLDNLERIDIRKVEKFEFVHLLTEAGQTTE